MNPLDIILQVMHKHMTADSDEIYVNMLRLVQYVKDETETKEYETDSEGEKIIKELMEEVQDFELSLREDEDSVDDDDEDDDLDREADEDDDEPINGDTTSPT